MLKEISELLEAGVINKDTADKIEQYYLAKGDTSTNRLIIVFAILGATLIGLGIISLIAHNWDELSRITKTVIAFIPLLLGQVFCGFTILKKFVSESWRESTTAFLIFSIGASIALISQIYNIPGDLSAFMLTWLLLSLPLIFIMKSSIASILYLIGITYYVCITNYGYPPSTSYLYWLLLILALPHYYLLYKHRPQSNFMYFHNWLIPLSIVIAFGIFNHSEFEIIILAYLSLLGIYYMIGQSNFFTNQKIRINGYKVIGTLGSIGILLALSFDWYWEELLKQEYQFMTLLKTPEVLIATTTSLLALISLYFYQKNTNIKDFNLLAPLFLSFIVIFLMSTIYPIGTIMINIYLFALGVLTIREGANKNQLGKVNFGLLIITALITCRFFDINLSFIIRGILFIAVGIGFFMANYWMLNKRV